MKKLLLGLGTLATIATPITMVVSCGDKTTSTPLYTKDKDLIMPDETIENIVSNNGFTKIDLEKDPDQIKDMQARIGFNQNKSIDIQGKVEYIKKEIENLQELQKAGNVDRTKENNIYNEIQDLRDEIQNYQFSDYESIIDQSGDDQQYQSNINISSDLSNLKYDKDVNNAYYKDTITIETIQIPSLNSYYYNDDSETINLHKIDYIITNKKTNEILHYPAVNDSTNFSEISISDLDSKLEELSFDKIKKLNNLRKLIQNPDFISTNEKGKDEKNSIQSEEIIKNIFFHSMNAIPADGSSADLDWMDQEDIERLNAIKKEAKENEKIVYIWGGGDVVNKDNFLRLKWLPTKFQFDESIYHVDLKDDSNIDNDMLSYVQRMNNYIRNKFKNRADFDKKVNEMFFKKFISDSKLNELISKFNLKKVDDEKDKIYTLEERMALQHKWEHQNIASIDGGTSGNHNSENSDTYYSIVSSHGIRSEIDFYISKDGSNKINIYGGQGTSPEEDAKGFKKAFDHGITSTTLNDISSLINLRRDHNDKDLYNFVLDSMMGIDTSFNPNSLDEKTPDGDENPQKITYDKIQKSLNSEERVVAFKKGENKYQFIKIKSSQDGLKLDLSIYNDSEFDQKVKANKLNGILSVEFGDKEGFFKKLDDIFY